jgi:hypothetical protein
MKQIDKKFSFLIFLWVMDKLIMLGMMLWIG